MFNKITYELVHKKSNIDWEYKHQVGLKGNWKGIFKTCVNDYKQNFHKLLQRFEIQNKYINEISISRYEFLEKIT